MFGRLTWDAFKHNPIETGAGLSMLLGLIAVSILLTYFKRWKWIWKEWITSLDPKRIGVMYLVVAFIMLFKGLMDAVMMRAQQVLSVGESQGYLTADHFQQVFTAHGTTMIFFVAMGLVFGVFNLIVPLQIGARDVAFPFLNSVGFWLFASGALLLNVSLVIGYFSPAGWLGYPPLASVEYNPGVGVDYWIWLLQVAGVGSLISAVNFTVTIIKMRCPGMTLMRMPVFVWSVLNCLVLILFAFPILTATLSMLAVDRLMGMHFFTPDFGGNQMLFVNFIWAWGHPEVYILILPAFGIFSEVVPVFSHKRLFGYVSMLWALGIITFLSFIVWLHHFFTMGAGANVNAFFGIMTMLIALPTGVKVFNWLFTMFRGRVQFTTPMLWFLGFVLTFTIGGMAGVLMSVPAADFQVHNSLFLIAHFHSVIIGGVVFGFFAGYSYWFPKFSGFTLNEKWGKWAFYCWFIGFLLAFLPLYLLGFMGATRRLDHYDAGLGWEPFFGVAALGVALITVGFCFQVLQLLVSIKERKAHLDTTGDPWNGRTLEWSTASPPPLFNFGILPRVHERDAFWAEKQAGGSKEERPYRAIMMPKNSGMGFYIGALSFFFAFGMVWHMFWLVGVSFIGILICLIIQLSRDDVEFRISAEEVKQMEEACRKV